MRAQRKVFYQYKILVQLKNQISFDGMNLASLNQRTYKNNLLRKIFDEISSNEKFIEFYSNKRLISIKKEYVFNSDILAFKLARKKDMNVTKKEENFVEDIFTDYPNSLIFLDAKSQTFYVERKHKLFNKPYEMNKILVDLLYNIKDKFIEYSDADFLVNVIVDQKEFIECYNTFDVVNKISLTLNSPNSFLGNQKADELLNELREETNVQETKIELANKESGINANGFLNQFSNLYEYAVNGGGEWAMQGKENGKTLTKKSIARGKTLILNLNIENLNINADTIIQVLEKENRYEEN